MTTTDTIALSTLTAGDHFNIDGGPTLVFRSIDYPEVGSEAIIRFAIPSNPGEVVTRHLVEVNNFAFYAAT